MSDVIMSCPNTEPHGEHLHNTPDGVTHACPGVKRSEHSKDV